MCNRTSIPKSIFFSTGFLYAAAVLLGIICGVSDYTPLHTLGSLISDVFIRIFKCISLPIISLSIIVTLSQYGADPTMKGVWQKTLFYTITTTILAAAVACVLYLIVQPENIVNVSNHLPSQVTEGGYLSYLMNMVPSNILAPFLEHQVMGVLLVSIVLGISIRFIPESSAQEAIKNFFKGAHGIFIVITGWVVKIIPLALFGFITATILQLKSGAHVQGLGGYLAVVVAANVIQGFIVLPLLLKGHGINPFKTMKSMMPALSVAFFSKSSAGTLPVTIETAEKNLGIRPQISRFVLPLCTSINMNGCAAFIFTTVIFLMQNQGISISFSTMGLWIFISTLAAVGNAGVPMGCFFLSASLLTSMDVPITLLGLILPFYSVIDMVETSLNVWSDACVAKVIDTRVN